MLEPAAKDCTKAGKNLLGLVAVVGARVTAGGWDCPARLGARRGELSSLAAQIALVPGVSFAWFRGLGSRVMLDCLGFAVLLPSFPVLVGSWVVLDW